MAVNRGLWLKLILPLTLLSGAALAVHHWWDYDSALVNLGTGLVVVMVTVLYVDWVIRRHEAERWSGTDARVTQRIEVFENALISSVRRGLGFSPDILNLDYPRTIDPEQVHQEILRIAEHVLAPAARARVADLDETGWKLLMTSLQSICAEAERILDRFYHRLRPRQVEILLDIQSSIDRALIPWRTFPDIMGVPSERLPQSRTPPEDLQSFGCESTAEALRQLMTLAIELDSATRS